MLRVIVASSCVSRLREGVGCSREVAVRFWWKENSHGVCGILEGHQRLGRRSQSQQHDDLVGTGKFLEVLAPALHLPLEEFGSFALGRQDKRICRK